MTGELAQQVLFLLGPQTTHSARLGDVQALHDLAGPDSPHAGERLEHGGDLHLAHDFVVGAPEEIPQIGASALELFLELGSFAPRHGRLGQSIPSLLFAERRWQGHDGTSLRLLRCAQRADFSTCSPPPPTPPRGPPAAWEYRRRGSPS